MKILFTIVLITPVYYPLSFLAVIALAASVVLLVKPFRRARVIAGSRDPQGALAPAANGPESASQEKYSGHHRLRLWYGLCLLLAVFTYFYALDSPHIPKNGDFGPKPFSGPDMRPVWQPRLIIEGKPDDGVAFDAWRADWPRDGSDLSNKTIEIYLPKDNQSYPSYFPYWLQINGTAGKAKIRIIDSGSNLQSPKPPLSAYDKQA